MSDYDAISVPQNRTRTPVVDPADPAPFWDVAAAAWQKRTVEGDKWAYTDRLRSEMTTGLYDRLDPTSRQQITAQMNGRKFVDPQSAWAGLVFDRISVERAANPDKWKDAPSDLNDAYQRIDARRRSELQEAQAILDLPGGGVAEFLGSAAREVVDPINIMLAPLGVEGSAARVVAGEAVLGGVAEGLSVPTERDVASDLGLPDPSLTGRVLEGVLFSGGVAGAIVGAGRYLSYLRRRSTATREVAPEGMTGQEFDAEVTAAGNELKGSVPPSQYVADRAQGAIDQALPPIAADAPEGWREIRNGIFAGESGGDYDALFAYQNRAGGAFAETRLTEMTVDEAIAFSDPSGPYAQWVKGRIGRVATPMGAYQIVGSTLRDAKRALGLRGTERMTADLQERLGQWIYRAQGTGAWSGYRGPRQSFKRASGGVAGDVPVRSAREAPTDPATRRSEYLYEPADPDLMRRLVAAPDVDPAVARFADVPDAALARGADTPDAARANEALAAQLRGSEADAGFGPVLTGFEGDLKGAVEALRAARTGEVPNALSHPQTGPIALVWGREGGGKGDGYGLSKILRHHPEVLDNLQGRLSAAEVTSRSKNRIRLESQRDKFAVRLDWDGKQKTWLLTGFEKRPATERSTVRPRDGAEGSSPSARPSPEDNALSAVDQGPDLAAEIAAARTSAGDLTLKLDDGTEISAADLLDDIAADQNLAEVLALCNPGGGA
jgi:hypothetical protein